MSAKSQQLQIRVSPQQKAALRRLASAAGLGVSEFVLLRALPAAGERFAALLHQLGPADDGRFVLAEIHDLLVATPPIMFEELVAAASVDHLTPLHQNYVAAMVEKAAVQKRMQPPAWTRLIAPLAQPWFAAPLGRLRPWLLRASPAAFKRRNLFIDASLGDRV